MTGTFIKAVNLLNFTRTTSSTTYQSTADREPLWNYTSGDYDGVNSIKFATVMRAASGDIQANLTTATDYRARWKRSAGSGTESFDYAGVLISQTNPTKTVTIIEIAEHNNVPSTSYSAATNYAIWKYDAGMFDGTVAAYLEADLHCNASGDTTYSALYNITATAQVSSSEVSHTGNTTLTRKISGAITLVDASEYRADIKGTSTSDDIAAVKIVIKQTGTITRTACYIPVVASISIGTETSYTTQSRLFTFNNTDFSASVINYYYEATLKVSANTGYSQLYNITDSAQIAAVSTNSTSYIRQRSALLTMPTDTNNSLGNYRKIDTSGTVSHARTFLIVFLIAVPTSGTTALGDSPLFSDANLIAYYPFQGNSTDTKGGFNGTDTAITYDNAYGKFLQGSLFNGSTSKILTSALGVGGGSARTISFWLKPTTLPAVGEVFGYGANSSEARFLILFNTALTNDFYVSFNNNDYSTISHALYIGDWMHLAVVYDGGVLSTSTVHLYINSVAYSLTKAGAGTGAANTTNADYGIGADPLSGGNHIDGALDDFAVFNRALSSTEISNLYLSNWPITSKKLLLMGVG